MNPVRAAGVAANLHELPSIDELLRTETALRLAPAAGQPHLTVLAREAVGSVRTDLLAGSQALEGRSPEQLLAEAADRMEDAWLTEQRSTTRRVINATGVVIHTNLGRAPLSENARRAIADEAAGYCTLEYDIDAGTRGHRGKHAEDLVAELTGAEAALVVNNCAAAAFLVLKTFADGGEVVISRGELVEIGGDFRIPDVLVQSGAALREVGTTNRTKLADYENAIGENTRLVLRVHPSNYRIVGFTASPETAELAETAHKHGVLIYEDIGSGALVDLGKFGLHDEPVVSRSIRAGVDIVTFSGDKLLGGPQSGIIAGRREYIDRLRNHPLYRALRVDKLAYAALEATLDAYRRGSAEGEIPVLKMLAADTESLKLRALGFAEKARQISGLMVETLSGLSVVGGGAAPNVQADTTLVSVSHQSMSAELLEDRFRGSTPPVIARIENDRVLIDLRTVSEAEEPELLSVLSRFAEQNRA